MIKLKEIEAPKPEEGLIPVMLSDETMQNRKARLLENMQKDGFDAVVVYADLEMAVILNICAVFYRALRKHCLFFMQMVRHLWYWEMKI